MEANTTYPEPTTTGVKPRRFICKCHNQTLVVIQPRELRDDAGRRYGMEPQKEIVFEDHNFTADEQSAAKVGMPLEELIAYIRNHDLFEAGEQGGIWDEGNPPEAEQPSVGDQTRKLTAAFVNQDPEAIAEILAAERGLHNRGAVLMQGTALLEQMAGE